MGISHKISFFKQLVFLEEKEEQQKKCTSELTFSIDSEKFIIQVVGLFLRNAKLIFTARQICILSYDLKSKTNVSHIFMHSARNKI